MILQQLLFPNESVCREKNLYFNGKNIEISTEAHIKKDGLLETNTYFNSFSIMKWKKYTHLQQLKLELDIEGICDICLCYAWIDSKNIIRLQGDNKVVYQKGKTDRETLILQYPACPNGVIAYFRIFSYSDTTILYRANYQTDCKNLELNSVKIAVGICTFRREEFVEKNLKLLKDTIIHNPASVLYDNLYVFVSDNGQTLSEKTEESLYIFHNKNVGGSGGFTRCIIEAKKQQEEKNFSHIILMDDDILLDPNVLERTYMFLRFLKKEYKDAMIGGSMLILDKPYQQFENAALYRKGKLIFKNNNIDLRTFRNVIQNERLFDRNYNAWCYCCMPLSKINWDNLPLPLFIHMDDVEYGARNNFEVITINGIGVWHPFFTNQRGASIVYYDVRNKLIVMSELGGRLIDEYALEWLNIFHRSIFNYDYERTMAACQAIKDFCKGIDAFMQIDPVSLNQTLSKYNKPWEEADEELRSRIDNTQSVSYLSKKGLLKNYLLPAKKEEIVVNCNISEAFPYRAKQVTLINRITGKKCIYRKSFKKMIACKLECRKAKKLIKNKMYDVSIEWKERIHEITNIKFWEQYLDLGQGEQ